MTPFQRRFPQQDDKLEVFESNENDVRAAVDIRGFNATAYRRIDICFVIDQIQDVQHPLRNVDPVHNVELEAPFRHHGLDYSPGLISVTTLQPVVKPPDPFELLDCIEERRMVIRNDCHVLDVYGPHFFNVLRSLRQSTYMALQAMSDPIQIRYISREDENSLLARKIIKLSLQNNYSSAIFRPDTRFFVFVHCLINYAVTYDLE